MQTFVCLFASRLTRHDIQTRCSGWSAALSQKEDCAGDISVLEALPGMHASTGARICAHGSTMDLLGILARCAEDVDRVVWDQRAQCTVT